jgi:S1-C subfamily serine protease
MHLSKILCSIVLFALSALSPAQAGNELARAIETVKPSIVGIGSFQKLRSPSVIFSGTGFVVGDGLTVLTNAHVVQAIVNSEQKDMLGIMIGMGDTVQFRSATLEALDKEHDLAQLSIVGPALPALKLGDSGSVTEGQAMAFTGFPLGLVLGLHHVTHRALVSSITPVVMPSMSARQLNPRLITQLHKPLYDVFQLDATAYPGSSGSPLYDPETGLVYGVINMVYVKGLKEAAISNPSGITYAIPAHFLRAMMGQKQIKNLSQ